MTKPLHAPFQEAASRPKSGGIQGLPRRQSAQSYFNGIAPRYETLAHDRSAGLAYLGARELDFIRAQLRPRPGLNFMDVGSGTGRITADLIAYGAEVTCVDIATEMLSQNRVRNGTESVHYLCADASGGIPIASNSVDGAVCCRVLKYMASWRHAIAEIARVTRPGGTIVIEITTRVSCEALSLPFKPMTYHLFDPREVESVLAANGITVVARSMGTRFPFSLYGRVRTDAALARLLVVERALDLVLPRGVLNRSIILAGRVDL